VSKNSFLKAMLVLALLFIPSLVHAQKYEYDSVKPDPNFISKVYNHQFNQIPESTGSHIDMISVNRAFNDHGCKINDRSGIDDSHPLERFAKLQSYITGDVASMTETNGDNAIGWPGYHEVVRHLDAEGCNSKWSQRVMKNVNLLMIERSDNTPIRSWRDSPLNGGSGGPTTYNRKTGDR